MPLLLTKSRVDEGYKIKTRFDTLWQDMNVLMGGNQGAVTDAALRTQAQLLSKVAASKPLL